LGPIEGPPPPDPFAVREGEPRGTTVPVVQDQTAASTAEPRGTTVPVVQDQAAASGIDSLRDLWPKVLAAVRSGKGNSPRAYLMLREAVPLRIEGKVIFLGFPRTKGFHMGQVDSPKLRSAIEEHIATAFAPGYTIRGELADIPEQGERAQADPDTLVRDSQLISKALDMFDGELIEE